MMLHRVGAALLAASVLSIALPVRAANWDEYLLDDTAGVLTVNVKQVLASPAYTKDLQRQVEKLLQMDAVATVLKGSGFNPLKDVERVTQVYGRSLYPVEGKVKEGTPLIAGTVYVIVQGNLDATRLKMLTERTGRQTPMKVTEHKDGAATRWELLTGGAPLHVAVPEKGTVIISGIVSHVTDALAKAVGKKKTQLKSKAMNDLLASLDLKASVSWVATGDLIFGTAASSFRAVGEKSAGIVTVTHQTLGDSGITSATGSLAVADDLQGTTTLTCNDANKAGSMANDLKKYLQFLENRLENETKEDAKRREELAPLVPFLKGTKITSKDQTVTIKARGSAQLIEVFQKVK